MLVCVLLEVTFGCFYGDWEFVFVHLFCLLCGGGWVYLVFDLFCQVRF